MKAIPPLDPRPDPFKQPAPAAAVLAPAGPKRAGKMPVKPGAKAQPGVSGLRTLADLAKDPENPREIDDAAFSGLQLSMAEFGDLSGIVFNKRTGHLVAGHQRTEGLSLAFGDLPIQKVGEQHFVEAPDGKRFAIRLVDWDIQTQRIANIAANNPHIAGHFTKSLQSQLDDIRARSDEMFKGLRMHDLLAKPARAGLSDPDQVPPVPTVPRTKPGDMYLLGSHRLMCGDATRKEHAAKLMDGQKADLVVTDPPYNVAYEGKTKSALTIENDEMGDVAFGEFLAQAYASYFQSAKAGAGIYVFHADMEGANFRTKLKESGFLFKQCCIWIKDVFVMSRQDFHWKHEPILYGWKPGAPHNWYSDRKQTTVWDFKRPTKSTDHPTMKPVDLISYPITCSSKVGDTVIDFFGGSGTTLIACEALDRVCYTMELDPRYCDVIVARYETFTGRKAKLVA